MAWNILINSNKKITRQALAIAVDRMPRDLHKPLGGTVTQSWGLNCATEIHYPHSDIEFMLKGNVWNQSKANIVALHMKRALEEQGHRITVHPIAQE
jgi:hypothetical protein